VSDMNRREAVGFLAAASLATMAGWSPAQVERVRRFMETAGAAGGAYQPRFFTQAEWETVRVLVDLIIPRDERSGSATDAGVPQFMDFLMLERSDEQLPMRGGLAWLDAESVQRFGKPFVELADRQRRSLLDDIAWPGRARSDVIQGVTFFNRFRDLTASGFWSSKIGVADLEYQGNVVVGEWTGCPQEALAKLGVSYQGGR
jgi:gluconate 2-dehydrogenase subunit 3-like protein